MDLTDNFIKMCEKAKKYFPKELIMELDYNTFWAQKHNGKWAIDIRGCIPKEDVPLLRQDQLQEMIGEKFATSTLAAYYQALMDFSERKRFICGLFVPGDHYFESHEQLLLAYVMEENFHKTWSGEDWV